MAFGPCRTRVVAYLGGRARFIFESDRNKLSRVWDLFFFSRNTITLYRTSPTRRTSSVVDCRRTSTSETVSRVHKDVRTRAHNAAEHSRTRTSRTPDGNVVTRTRPTTVLPHTALPDIYLLPYTASTGNSTRGGHLPLPHLPLLHRDRETSGDVSKRLTGTPRQHNTVIVPLGRVPPI